jgi:hypothetical protein
VGGVAMSGGSVGEDGSIPRAEQAGDASRDDVSKYESVCPGEQMSYKKRFRHIIQAFHIGIYRVIRDDISEVYGVLEKKKREKKEEYEKEREVVWPARKEIS